MLQSVDETKLAPEVFFGAMEIVPVTDLPRSALYGDRDKDDRYKDKEKESKKKPKDKAGKKQKKDKGKGKKKK